MRSLVSPLLLALVVVTAGAASARAQVGARLLVLDVQARGAISSDEEAATRALVTDALRGREGLLVATSADVRQRAPLEADRAAGCEEELCLHELADALDSDFVLFGHVEPSATAGDGSGAGRVVRLGLFEEKSGEIIEREEVSGADIATLAPFVGAAMNRLLAPVLAEAEPNVYEQPLFLAGAGVAAAGALLAVGAGGWALELELSLGEAGRHRDVKKRALLQGPLALALAGSGAALAVVGGGALLTAFLLDPP